MPIDNNVGPGGVSASYGRRSPLGTREYSTQVKYGDTFREVGDGPVAGTIVSGIVTGNNTKEASVANRLAIQKALDSSGWVQILNDGAVFIDTAVLIGSHTRLTLGQKTELRLVNGMMNPNNYGTTTITSVGTVATVTVTTPFPASLIGKSVIMGVGGVANVDGYNGLWQFQIVNATTANYNLVTSVSGVAATGNIKVFGPYMDYGFQDNVIRNKNFFSKKVALSNPTVVAPYSVGSVSLRFDTDTAGGWKFDDWILIKGDTSRAANGAHRVIEATPTTVTIEFFSTTVGYPGVTGSLYASSVDVDSIIEGGTINGGGGNEDASWLSHGICLNKTSNFVVQNIRTKRVNKYSITYCNSASISIRDIHLETVSDGVHSKGPNWNVVLDGISGANNDDFIVHTSNDPEQAYAFNVFPRNAGATVQTVYGPFTLGHTDQGTIAAGGGELVGFTARNIRPKFKNARILLSGADAAKPFNGMSGILIDGFTPSFDNEATNGSYDIPSICISSEPSTNHTSVISDVTIRNWSILGNTGKAFVNFYDQQVGGPYAGSQVVIRSLVFDNVRTAKPIVRKAGAQWEFLDGRVWTNGDRWSVGKLTFRDCRWDVDTGTSGGDCSVVYINNNNANSEYLDSLVFDNCQLNHVGGNQVLRLLTLGGSSGSKLKHVSVTGSTFDSSQASSLIEVIDLGNSGATNNLIINLQDNQFKKVRFVTRTNGTLFTLIASGNYLQEAGYACFVYGGGSFAFRMAWQNNIIGPGIKCVDDGVAGYIVLSGDTTLSLDLSKVSRNSPGAMAKARAAAGTILAGNLVICDATNTTNSWKQISNTTLTY